MSSFAALSPQELLRETQRAAGDDRLTSWHETLVKLGKEHRELNIVSIRREGLLPLFIDALDRNKNLTRKQVPKLNHVWT